MGAGVSNKTRPVQQMSSTAPVKLRGKTLKPSKVPAVTVFGTLKHKHTVQHFYRRCLKNQYFWTDITLHYSPGGFAWSSANTRQLFEENRNLKDPAIVNNLMRDMEDCIDEIPPWDPHKYPWEGPGSAGGTFMQDYITRVEQGRWFEGCMIYADGWIEYSMDEHYTKLKIEQVKHRQELILQNHRLMQDDFLYFYGMKKEMEREARWEIGWWKKSVHRSRTQMALEWPYVYPKEIEAAGAWGDPMRSASSPDLNDQAQWSRDEEKIYDKDLISTVKFWSLPVPMYIPWCPGKIHDFAV